jgi:hypothetical protein
MKNHFILPQGSQRFSQISQVIEFKEITFSPFALTLCPLRLKILIGVDSSVVNKIIIKRFAMLKISCIFAMLKIKKETT